MIQLRRQAACVRLMCALGLGTLFLGGCGGGPPTGTVSGTVTLDGQPLKTGTVTFVTSENRQYHGTIQEGAYRVEKVPIGEVKIAISVPTPPPMPKGVPQGQFGPPKGAGAPEEALKAYSGGGQYIQIPSHYTDPERSGLRYEVKPGSQTYDIPLKKS
jgi:hypothetical protein